MRHPVYSLRRLGAKEFPKIVSAVGSEAVAVGIDVSKRELVLMLRRRDAHFLGPYRAANPGQIPELIQLLREVGSRGPTQVAMESSGTYGDALRQALSDAAIELQRVEAKRSHDYAEVFDGVPSQHDGKDAAVIAELCAIGKCGRWEYGQAGENESRMRLAVEGLDAQDRIRRLWLGRLEALLARHWPEATNVMRLRSGTLLRALVHYRGPAALAADDKALEKLLRWGGTLLRKDKAQTLIESAKTTLGVRQNAVDQERLGRCAKAAREASLEINRCRGELKELAKGNRVIEAQAKAVGVATACVLWTRLGDPHNYPSAGAYRKAMGLNLTERSSGQYKGLPHLSKRGDPLVRRWMHMAGLRLIGMHSPVGRWYRDKRRRSSGSHLCAITGVVRRLAMALHRVPVGNQEFDARRLFAGPAAADASKGTQTSGGLMS